MKINLALSALLLLGVAVIASGCRESREEQIEDAAEDAADRVEDMTEKAGDAAKEAADEMEDKVDDMSSNGERQREETLAVNRYRSFVQRIDELSIHLASVQRPGVDHLRTTLDGLREQSIALGDRLSMLKSANTSREWARSKQEMNREFEQLAERIQSIGNEMHELVCALHHHDGMHKRPTVLAAAN